MQGSWQGDVVVVGGTARQQFHDTRGFGSPLDGPEIALTPVEAAYLMARGDLETVDDEGLTGLFARATQICPGFAQRFLAYTDLRNRGFYVAPHRDGWVSTTRSDADYLVYERGSGPHNGTVGFHLRVVAEQEEIPAQSLGSVVLAVIDDESEVTYLQTTHPTVAGDSDHPEVQATGALIHDRVIVVDPPKALYHRGFYGRPLDTTLDSDPLQISLVEATYLVDQGVLDLAADRNAETTLAAHGRDAEGDRFDRRARVYAWLREHGIVPKSGLKFGADFRIYPNVTSVEDLGHSTDLVHVIPPDHVFVARELALMVRLAHGVRKRTLFAVTDGTDVLTWIGLSRLTP